VKDWRIVAVFRHRTRPFVIHGEGLKMASLPVTFGRLDLFTLWR